MRTTNAIHEILCDLFNTFVYGFLPASILFIFFSVRRIQYNFLKPDVVSITARTLIRSTAMLFHRGCDGRVLNEILGKGFFTKAGLAPNFRTCKYSSFLVWLRFVGWGTKNYFECLNNPIQLGRGYAPIIFWHVFYLMYL